MEASDINIADYLNKITVNPLIIPKRGVVMRIFNFLKYKPPEDKESFSIPKYTEKTDENAADIERHVTESVLENKKVFQQLFRADKNTDIVIRDFITANKTAGFIVYIDGMVRSDAVNEYVLKPLFLSKQKLGFSELKSTVQINAVGEAKKYSDAVKAILMGDTAVCVDGCGSVLTCETKGFDRRSVSKPENENTIKGSKEGFTESIRTNTTLIRKIVKHNSLVSEFVQVGNLTGNYCAVMYMDGLANPELVNCVKQRLKSIKSDFVAGSGMIEQFIEDGAMKILPGILSTERPDTAALHLCQGRIAVVVDGTPFVLIMPVSAANFIKSAEDSSLRWQYATLFRIIRFFSMLIAMLLPGIYIAIVNYHRGMIPTDLLIAIAKSQENVPFPAVFEILLLEFSFELIKEAGVRVPGAVGNTIGIVGGLILGQSAVTAGIVSPVVIIIIAFTVIANFAIPDYSFSIGIRILRITFILLAAALGFAGIGIGLMLAGVISAQNSFGVGMLSPVSPKTSGKANLLYNPPVWKKEKRPDELNASSADNQPHISREWRYRK